MNTLEQVIDRANGGIVGIDSDLNVFGGYDQQFEAAGVAAPEEWQDYELMPAEERVRLANRMIALWTKYREVVSAQ